MVCFLIDAPALLFSIVDLTTNLIILGVKKGLWGYEFLPKAYSVFYWIENILAIRNNMAGHLYRLLHMEIRAFCF